MTQPTIELLPCPFCGGKAEHEQEQGATGAQHYVNCCSHTCIGFFQAYNTFATKADATKAWNTRAALTAQAGDGNRLPLEEVPEGWVVFNIGNDDPDGVDFSWYALLREKAVPGMSSADSRDRIIVGADGATAAEALRAAIQAAKDGAG